MPPQNMNAFLGAALLGVIGACGMYVIERYKQQKNQVAMAKDLARLDQELRQVKRELDSLLKHRSEKSNKSRKSKMVNKAHSVVSNSTIDDYLSASNLDSSDLEFYDISDHESDTIEEDDNNLENELQDIDFVLESDSSPQLENVLERLKALQNDHPNNVEILWRIGKTHHVIADLNDNNEVKKDHINEGIGVCETAMNINPNNADVHKWFAILIGSRSEMVSTKDKIRDGHLFKKHVDAALAINPNDASLHHMLGRFDYEVASLKWFERKVAATLFEEPPNATYEDALKHFLEAENLTNFDWKENKMMIAKCKIALKEYKDALEWLEKAVNLKQGDNMDNKIDLEVKMLLNMYSRYS